jgi:hypothetical protein
MGRLDPNAELDHPLDPGVAALVRGDRVVGGNIMKQHAAVGSLVVAADPDDAARTLHDNRDAVELLVARMKYVA